MENPELFQTIKKNPTFSILSDEEVEYLARECRPLSFKIGQVICKEGEQDDSLYIIFSGRVRMATVGQDGDEMSIATLTKGDHFGEQSLLTRSASAYTIRAAEDATVFRLQREAFERLLQAKPDLKSLFEQYIANLSIRNFLKRFTVFNALPANTLKTLLKHLKTESFSKGALVFREGATADKFYVLSKGRVKVVKKQGDGEQLLSVINEGGSFGELALLTNNLRAATVIADEDAELFSLSREGFESALELSPELKESMARIASQYRSAPPQELKAPPPLPAEVPAPPDAAPVAFTPRPKKGFWKRAFPFIRQHDETDCGAACLAMLSKFYGVEIGLSRLRDMANVNRDGSSMLSLSEAAQKLGYLTHGIHTAAERLSKLSLPAIAHWEGFHYIIVYKAEADIVHVADPGIGLRKLSLAEFKQGFTGRLLLFTPTGKIFETREKKHLISRWLPLFKPYWKIIAEVLLCSLLLDLFGLASPLFTQTIVDQVLVHQSVNMLNLMLIGMIIVSVFQIATSWLRQYLLVFISLRIDQNLIAQFIAHVLSLPLKYFEQRRVGDIISRIGENQKIKRMLVQILPSAFLDIMMTTVYLSLMFFYNWRMTLAALVFIPFFILLTLVVTPILKRINQELFTKQTETDSYVIETVTGVQTVKSMAVETSVQWKWNTLFVRGQNMDFKESMVAAGTESVSGLLNTLSSVLLLWYGAKQVMSGSMTVGQLMAFNALVGSVFGPIMRFVNLWDEVQGTVIAVDRLNDVFDAEPEEDFQKKPLIEAPSLRGHLRFENVFFSYDPTDKKGLLQNINLEVLPGTMVALVGRSGSGKTTLSKLLLRLYLPTRGKLFVDGYDIATLSPAGLRRQIGVVPQETFLFSGSIRENIALGAPEASLDQVVAASTLAGAHDFISEMPLGYQTPVGERGMSLSGGQRQRIAIARALLGDPRILIFDEATASLDTESERAIQKNIAEILSGRTTFVIAHRLSTVQNANMICVLDRGMIVESGGHHELMAQRGLYFYLVNQQVNI